MSVSKYHRLNYLMNEQTRVKVTNPAFPNAPWVGTIIGLTENPSLILDQEGSFRVTLPQAFAVEPANKAPSSPVGETDGETGTELRPCDSVSLTWLEIGAATREGIAKEIESAMQYEGVRAQRVMGMCAYIARTWKP